MSPFQFRLATLLKLRKRARDARREELAKAYYAQRVIEGQLEEIDQEKGAIADAVREGLKPGVVNVDGLLGQHRRRAALDVSRADLEGKLATVAAEVERRRQVAVEADRQVRVLEKLRDKQQAAHQKEQQRQDIRELDEIAGRQFLAGRP